MVQFWFNWVFTVLVSHENYTSHSLTSMLIYTTFYKRTVTLNSPFATERFLTSLTVFMFLKKSPSLEQ